VRSSLKKYIGLLLGVALLAALGICLFLGEEEDILAGKTHYGTLLLSCEVEGLPIYIDEQQVGVTSKQQQSFPLLVKGSYGRADHELVVRQKLDEQREYYFHHRFSFSLYADVEESPSERVALFLDAPENRSYPPENFQLQQRLMPQVQARQDGLVASVKLKHNRAWNMAEDEVFYYLLTRAETDLSRQSENETEAGEYIEVYAKRTLEFVGQQRLSPKYDDGDIFSRYTAIGVSGSSLYVADNQAGLLRFDKVSLQQQGRAERLPGPQFNVNGFTSFKDYLIAFGDGDRISVFKSGELLYQIDERDNYPGNITEIDNYSDDNRVNSITIHAGVIYATNWRGFINIYALEDGRFIDQINTISYNEEYKHVSGWEIQTGAVYQERDLYFSRDYNGLLILDSQTKDLQTIHTLFPEQSEYSELFGESYSTTKSTIIYTMVFYHHYLVFSEISGRKNDIYVYDLESRQIVHTFAGHRGGITKLLIDGAQLTGLSFNGLLYRWDLARL
jgi:hypothetical protein